MSPMKKMCKDKCKVLHLLRLNQVQNWEISVGNSSEEKGLKL